MNAWKTYGAHALGYVVSLATLVAGLDPALLGPQGAAIVAGAGLVLTLVHNVQTAAAVGPPTLPPPGPPFRNVPPIKALLPLLFGTLLAMTAAASLQGCKTAPTANQQAGIAVAVDIATGLAVQQGSNDPAVWRARAGQFKAIALQLKTINDAGDATLATLAADLQPLIAKLGPADVLAANALVAALTPYLQQQMQANPAVANTQAAVRLILDDLIQACTAYTG